MELCWKLTKSRRVLQAGGLATLVCLVALAVSRHGLPVWQQAVTLVLAAAVCLMATRFAAGMVASSCEESILEQLHLKLQPQSFLQAYEPVVRAMRPDSAGAVTASVNLADGYCAAGDWQQALRTVVQPAASLPEPQRSALQALVLRSRCRYCLWGGQPEPAQEALRAFGEQVEALRTVNPRLAENLQGDVALYTTWYGLLRGQPADRGALEKTMRSLPTKLAKLDVCWMLMLASRVAADPEGEQRYTSLLLEEGGALAAAETLRRR